MNKLKKSLLTCKSYQTVTSCYYGAQSTVLALSSTSSTCGSMYSIGGGTTFNYCAVGTYGGYTFYGCAQSCTAGWTTVSGNRVYLTNVYLCSSNDCNIAPFSYSSSTYASVCSNASKIFFSHLGSIFWILNASLMILTL